LNEGAELKFYEGTKLKKIFLRGKKLILEKLYKIFYGPIALQAPMWFHQY
jgi:hypothetical protein